MQYQVYDSIIREHFDILDNDTRKYLLSLDEAGQDQLIVSLSTKLYNKIVAKVADIDYGKIPESRGDITKIPNFIDLTECTDIMRNLLIQYKQSTEPTDIVFEAIENLRDSRRLWEKAFNINAELPIVFYNTIALSIVSGISFLISGSIDFIKDPANDSYQAVLDAYKNGDIEKAMKAVMDADKAVKEQCSVNEFEATVIIAGVVATVSLISVLKLILPILQELIALLYCARQNVSDYFSVQSDLVMLNAENVRLSTTKTPAEVNKIYKKQMKIANTFKKIANKLAVKIKSSENEAKKLVNKENKTDYKIGDDTKLGVSGGIF